MSAIAVALLAAAAAAPAADAALLPQDFAYARNIEPTDGGAAAYRMSLPLEVYATLVGADAGDLRVFNGNDELVPYELRRRAERLPPAAPFRPQPLFVLRGDVRQALDAVRVKIESGGTALDLSATPVIAAGPPSGEAPVGSYIVDVRGVDVPLGRLRLSWADSPTAYVGAVDVEASDDLANWRPVGHGPIANLMAGDTRLLSNEIEIDAPRSPYLRVTPAAPAPPFAFTGIAVQPAQQREAVPRMLTQVTGAAVADVPGAFDYDLGAVLYVDRLHLLLPEVNSVAEVDVEVRDAPTQGWRRAGRVVAWRMSGAGGELESGAQPLPPFVARFVRLRSDPARGGLGRIAPRLEVGWVPHELRFLARGPAPFRLAYGRAGATRADVDLDGLVPGLGTRLPVLEAALGAQMELGGARRLVPPPATVPWQRVIMWIVLVAGVVAMGLMAWKLSREVRS
ncbi:MAG: DUF3999 domain-containing protein [Steroidobacteraceae bacterium]